MKNLYLILLLSLFNLFSYSQSANMNLLGTWKDVSIPQNNNGQTYNDCWGWEQGGREYAVIGSRVGSHIIDVTNPNNPIEVDRVIANYTGSNVIHRDYKVHKGHLYMVGDQGSSSLQIADLSFLPDSVHVVYDDNSLVVKSHNVFVDSITDRLYSCGGSKQSGDNDLRIFDISSPANPILLVDLKDDISWWSNSVGYVHDIYVENNIAYTHDLDAMHIVDFNNINSPIILGTLSSYPDKGINHSGWLHNDDSTYIMLDETHGKRLKFMDVSDPNNMIITDVEGTNTSSTAIAHNGFIHGDLAYVSYYYDGVYVFDVSDRNNVTIAGFYDTYQGADGNGFHGCWGVYPYLPSGNIIASDLETGLYVLGLNASPLPVANFNASPTIICTGDSVSFNNTSISGQTYQWSFPGGTPSSSSLQNPIVTYNSIGNYDVTLVTTNANGNNTSTKTNYISVTQGPCSNLPAGGTAPIQTSCTGTIFDNGGGSDKYAANQDSYIRISPTGATQVDISFSSFDIEGFTNCGYDFIEIFDGINFSAPSLGKFCNTNIPPSTISSTGGSVYIHFHTDGGTELQGFQLDWSCSQSVTTPTSQFSANSTNICEGIQVNYSNQSTNATSYLWTFPGGTPSSSTMQNPIVTYNTAGIYNAKLVSYSIGGADSIVKNNYITVNSCNGQPIINFATLNQTINESAGIFNIEVSISNPYTSPVYIQIEKDNISTMTTGNDFTTLTAFPITLIFPANSTANQIIPITIVDDAILESTETLILNLFNSINGTIGNSQSITITTNDNETSGISEVNADMFQIFPNPINAGKDVNFNKKVSFEVYNVSGKSLFGKVYNNKFSTSKMSSGCYFIKINNRFTKLIVK